MNDTNLPWDELTSPASGIHTKKCTSYSHGEIFWAKDNVGTKLFLITLTEDQRDIFREQYIQLKGIGIDLRKLEGVDRPCLILSLEQTVDGDIFYELCRTLTTVVEKVSTDRMAVTETFRHLKRWKAFLAGSRQCLTYQQVIGLIGELLFLRQLMHKGYDTLQVIESWMGPEDGNQDFIFLDSAIEIKTISGKERNRITISSEDQFETVQSRLFLRIFRLIETMPCVDSFSLNSLIQELKQNMCIESDMLFDARLALAGYLPLVCYDKPHFINPEQQTYFISEAFPKIIRTMLPSGVLNVHYDILLASIKDFKCSDDAYTGDSTWSIQA